MTKSDFFGGLFLSSRAGSIVVERCRTKRATKSRSHTTAGNHTHIHVTCHVNKLYAFAICSTSSS